LTYQIKDSAVTFEDPVEVPLPPSIALMRETTVAKSVPLVTVLEASLIEL
jgi:hypothetical protein